jgi:hypothetical protein
MPARFRVLLSLCTLLLLGQSQGTAKADEPKMPAKPAVEWPLERSAYFVGELVPLAVRGASAGATVKLEAVGPDGSSTLLYQGPATTLLLDTSRLAPGDYRLAVDGATTGQRWSITCLLRRSAGSLQDEATPREPQIPRNANPEERATLVEKHGDEVKRTFRESGLTACFALGASDLGRAESLDVMARSGGLLLVNPDTRPTSFFPVGKRSWCRSKSRSPAQQRSWWRASSATRIVSRCGKRNGKTSFTCARRPSRASVGR